jgi:hypothetical protein
MPSPDVACNHSSTCSKPNLGTKIALKITTCNFLNLHFQLFHFLSPCQCLFFFFLLISPSLKFPFKIKVILLFKVLMTSSMWWLTPVIQSIQEPEIWEDCGLRPAQAKLVRPHPSQQMSQMWWFNSVISSMQDT